MINYTTQLSYSLDNRPFQFAPPPTSITPVGTSLFQGVYTVLEAAHTALPLGDVSDPGVLVIANTDADNTLQIGEDDASVFVPRQSIKPGRTLVLDLTLMPIPYVKAAVADCIIMYSVFDD